ncbi:MAG: hypothetical protein Q8M08_02815 [Bacteroidales bacterium]|nr:hypothetical protein [Bacteroidales bacterium]
MNYYYLTAGILAAMACIGHFTMGKKDFLKPVLESDIDEIPKKVMHSLFHYMSVFMVLTTIFFIGNAIGCERDNCVINSHTTVKFIGLIYAGFAVVQIIIAATSKIEKGIFKLFQWVFWILIAVFAFSGTC